MNKQRLQGLTLFLIIFFGTLYLIQRFDWEKQKKEFRIKLQDQETLWEEKYKALLQQEANLSQQLEEDKIKQEAFSQELTLLQKEKKELAGEIEYLRSPGYLTDIIIENTRLKLEIKSSIPGPAEANINKSPKPLEQVTPSPTLRSLSPGGEGIASAREDGLSAKLLEASEKASSLDDKLEQMEDLLKEKDKSFTLELIKTVTLPEKKNEVSPSIKGKILTINKKYNSVTINVGEDNGVRAGDKFSVYRDERKIGEIEARRIRSNSSLANITSLLEGIIIAPEDIIERPVER